MGRFIGISHRVKQTASHEARPTLVCIKDDAEMMPAVIELATETDELDFLLGRLPKKYRPIEKKDKLSKLFKRHIMRDELGKAIMVPKEYEGLQSGDVVAMTMGGSGDRFAYAISKHGQDIGAKLIRIKPSTLKDMRGHDDTDNDHFNLAEMAESMPELFEEITPRDAQLIRLREVYFLRQEAMKSRIACEQRLRQRFIGGIFLSSKGKYPEGNIEDLFDASKANDKVFKALRLEQGRLEREMAKLLEEFDVFQNVFKDIEGIGTITATQLIVAVGDIRRFATVAKFKKFCGLHVMEDGKFARRRTGEVASWQPEARQAFYLVGDQLNRRPGSKWGMRLAEYKQKFRDTHPEVMCGKCGVAWNDDCQKKGHKRKYGNGHIHRMATWRTVTKLGESIFKQWSEVYVASE